ncbi:MAG: hypothetical protein ABIB04_02505 [Patescibacteria group bacterium]
MTLIYRDRPSIIEFQNIDASTQASNIQIEKISSTEKPFSFFDMLKNFVKTSTGVIHDARLENKKRFPFLLR